MPAWDADVTIDQARASQLVRRHVPEIANASMKLLGQGWDNVAYLVDDTWVFRFPRRRAGGDLMRAELGVLTQLPKLPLPIPAPTFIVRDPDDYPYDFAGYQMIPGSDGDHVCPGTIAAARALGEFLAVLHSLPIPSDCPADTYARAALIPRADRVRERMATLVDTASHLLWDHAEAVMAAALQHDPPTRLHLVHGDLYPRHVMVDEAGDATGVIDWGDVHAGDSSGDLSIAWTWFDADSRAALLDSYQRGGGRVTRATLDRARFRALQYGTILIPYGRELSDQGLVRVGEHAVRETMQD